MADDELEELKTTGHTRFVFRADEYEVIDYIGTVLHQLHRPFTWHLESDGHEMVCEVWLKEARSGA